MPSSSRATRGGSRLGKQRFRFVGDGPEVTLGVTLADGHHGSISAEDGVIETIDAEIGAQLEAPGADQSRVSKFSWSRRGRPARPTFPAFNTVSLGRCRDDGSL